MNRSTAVADAAAGFPYPPRPAGPSRTAPKRVNQPARGPDSRFRPGPEGGTSDTAARRPRTPGRSRSRPGHQDFCRDQGRALMNDLNPAARPEPGTAYAAGRETRLPATIAFSQLPDFERTAPDGTPATVKFRRPGDLQPGDVISGQRDPWAVVTHVTWSGPEVAIRVQEAGGSRTMALRARGPSLDVRADLRVDPSTCPDIPDGFPPRWGVWRSGPTVPREHGLAPGARPGRTACPPGQPGRQRVRRGTGIT